MSYKLCIGVSGKAHNAAFSRALRTEMALEGYDVEVLHVPVLSAASAASQESVGGMTVSPLTMARGVLDRVGCGDESTMGCFRHAVVAAVLDALVPRKMVGKMTKDCGG